MSYFLSDTDGSDSELENIPVSEEVKKPHSTTTSGRTKRERKLPAKLSNYVPTTSKEEEKLKKSK